MPSNYNADDPILGQVDLDDKFVTDAWLIDQFVGNLLWGVGGYLGVGVNTQYSSPVQVGNLVNWKQVSTGADKTLALKNDSTLWAWGVNAYGGLGNNTITTYNSPIQIGALTNWRQVASAASYFSAAVKTNDTLWTWGQNNNGQLGNGTVVYYSSPIQIGALTNWRQVAIAVYGYNTAAIKTDGTLWTWGDNPSGQLGNNTTTNYSSPIQIGALTNWEQVDLGYKHMSAIKTDGTLWACGYNTYGGLGTGSTAASSSPVAIGALTNWKQVSCGRGHTAAVKTDGTLWAWGWNFTGQLGNGTVVAYSSPIQIGALTNWKQVSCNTFNTAAVKTDGTLWTWGGNATGQLGNGTLTYYSSPIQFGMLSNWKYVSIGGTMGGTQPCSLFGITYAEIT